MREGERIEWGEGEGRREKGQIKVAWERAWGRRKGRKRGEGEEEGIQGVPFNI